MKSRFLFPHYFRLIGWLLVVPGFVLGYLVVFQSYEIAGFVLQLRSKGTLFTPAFENFTNELALTMVIAGLLFVAFARLRHEDELTANLRLNALYWAILVNYIWYGVFIAFALLNSVAKMEVLGNAIDWLTGNMKFIIYNLFMPLVIFIARFNYLAYKSKAEYQVKPLRFLPNKPYKAIGMVLTAAVLLVSFVGFFIFNMDSISNVFYLSPFVMLLWVYAKESQEDEYIMHIRLDAMQIAVYGNYIMLLLSNWLVYSATFLLLTVINLITIPLIFIIVFNYRLYKINKQESKISAGSLNLGLL